MNYDKRVAAKVFKSFLSCSSKLIRAEGSEIRSFDGDRVMGVFISGPKNTSAARCALKINYAFLKIIKPKLAAKYPSLATGSDKLAHCVGVDASEVLVVRGGVRNNNDLVWGRPCAQRGCEVKRPERKPALLIRYKRGLRQDARKREMWR
jgi:class 3 adenylate cyclase